MFIGAAHKLGIAADQFWRMTMYEFTTRLLAHLEMTNPRPRDLSDAALAEFFRAQPGYRRSKETARA